MKTAPGFARFMKYIIERESIRLNKEEGKPWPWTKDVILQRGKFTNVHRIHDRTTVMFRNVYDKYSKGDAVGMADCLMNAATFRYFGTMEFAAYVGWQSKWSAKYTLNKAKDALAQGVQIFTGAYTITNGGRHGRKEDVVVEYLSALNSAAPRVAGAMSVSHKWEVGALEMYKLPGFGGSGFMAKEVLQDYLLMWPGDGITDKETWTPVGPGARRGLNRIFSRTTTFRQPNAKWFHEIDVLRSAVNAQWALAFEVQQLPLTAHDIQFCCCEFSKYEKLRLGEGCARNNYTPHLCNGIEIA